MINNSYTSKIYTQLKDEIINCTYPLTEILTEKEISNRFGSSKTPAREALNQLSTEGFLEKIPYKGYLIKKLSYHELKQIFQFREIIEVASVELAVKNAINSDIEHLWSLCKKTDDMNEINDIKVYNDINQRFHTEIARISRNYYLVNSLTDIMNSRIPHMFCPYRNQ